MDIHLHFRVGIKYTSAHLHVNFLRVHGIVLARAAAVDLERVILFGVLIIYVFDDVLGQFVKALVLHVHDRAYAGDAEHAR